MVDLLQELTDIDTLHESEEGAEVLIDALVSSKLQIISMPEQHLPYAAQQQILWTATLSASVVIHVAKTMMKLASWGACSLVAEMLHWGPRWVCLMGCQRLGSRFFLHLVYHFFFGRNMLILQNLCRLGDFSCREGEWSNIWTVSYWKLELNLHFSPLFRKKVTSVHPWKIEVCGRDQIVIWRTVRPLWSCSLTSCTWDWYSA